ncbi:MAG: glycosyltransferase family A protein, partial [Chthoniobacteraceae bacterium]
MNGGKDALFSLIVPTLNRREEVSRLLASIEQQTCRDFEVIIVDQNPNDVLDGICADFALRMPLLHLKTESKGAARARNYGLGFSKGTLINFPDDDCEFTPELLARVAAHLGGHPEQDALFARAVDPVSGESSVTKFDTRSQWVTAANLYRTTVEFTMFARRTLFDEVGLLDENLSPGTYFGAEEGADFVLRALYKKDKRLYYD